MQANLPVQDALREWIAALDEQELVFQLQSTATRLGADSLKYEALITAALRRTTQAQAALSAAIKDRHGGR